MNRVNRPSLRRRHLTESLQPGALFFNATCGSQRFKSQLKFQSFRREGSTGSTSELNEHLSLGFSLINPSFKPFRHPFLYSTFRNSTQLTSSLSSPLSVSSNPQSLNGWSNLFNSSLSCLSGSRSSSILDQRHFNSNHLRCFSTVGSNGSSPKKQKSLIQRIPKYFTKYITRPLSWSYTQSLNIIKLASVPILQFLRHPSVVFIWWNQLKDGMVHGWHWTKRGFKLFGVNFKISLLLVKKKIKGQPLNFREHKLLVRTTSDLVKLIPFSFFIAVPFAELLLPVMLWAFPGMLPSTFAEKNIDNPHLQRKLKAKQELTQFFQELVAARARQVLGEVVVR